METTFDYKKFAILYVDDEEMSLKYFARAFGDSFRILTATNAQDGLKLFEAHQDDIGLLMTDQRMPGEKGVWLLEQARKLRPRVIRILATAFADVDAAISAVNSGAIYKYITKPWDPPQMENTLARGLEFFIVQRERDTLLRERMSVLQNMMTADRIVSMGLLAAGMSHHIRNSLVAVKTFLDLAPEQLKQENVNPDQMKNPEFWKDYHQNVQGQIRKINYLLNELYSATEQRGAQFADTVNVREIIDAARLKIENDLASKKITVQNLVPDDLPRPKVDKPQFTRLFELLLRDEIVSLPAGAEVTLRASAVAPPGKPVNEICIELTDNGPGLTHEALRVLFDPFTPRSDSPAEFGINLMTCFFIIHHHGGKIDATSEPGRGTRFQIRLPTDPNGAPLVEENPDFFQKLMANEAAWERLIKSDTGS